MEHNGPWTVESGSHPYATIYVVNSKDQVVANCGDDNRQDQLDDARLISAAPEMLEVIQMFLDGNGLAHEAARELLKKLK